MCVDRKYIRGILQKERFLQRGRGRGLYLHEHPFHTFPHYNTLDTSHPSTRHAALPTRDEYAKSQHEKSTSSMRDTLFEQVSWVEGVPAGEAMVSGVGSEAGLPHREWDGERRDPRARDSTSMPCVD